MYMARPRDPPSCRNFWRLSFHFSTFSFLLSLCPSSLLPLFYSFFSCHTLLLLSLYPIHFLRSIISVIGSLLPIFASVRLALALPFLSLQKFFPSFLFFFFIYLLFLFFKRSLLLSYISPYPAFPFLFHPFFLFLKYPPHFTHSLFSSSAQLLLTLFTPSILSPSLSFFFPLPFPHNTLFSPLISLSSLRFSAPWNSLSFP